MSSNQFRWRVGDVFVSAEYAGGTWKVDITDAASRPVQNGERIAALVEVMKELSSLRHHIWTQELGNP